MTRTEERLKTQNARLKAVVIILLVAIAIMVAGIRTNAAFAELDDESETVEAAAAVEPAAEESEEPAEVTVQSEEPVEEVLPEDVSAVEAEPAELPAAFPAGKYSGQYVCSNTRTLDYWLLVPEHCTVGMPMIVYLHNDRYLGYGNFESLGETSAMATAVLDSFGDSFPAIILIPQAHYAEEGFIGAGMNDCLFGLINSVADEYLVDRDNISLTGSGRGATAVWYFIDTYGSFFSCAVPISCSPMYTSGYGMACASVPVLAYVGDGDDYACYGADMQAACDSIGSYGGAAVLEVVSGCGDHWETEYSVYNSTIINWLASGGDGIQAFQ